MLEVFYLVGVEYLLQNTTTDKYGRFTLKKEAITCNHQIDTFCCQQNEWQTKEDTHKSIKNALCHVCVCVLQYAKRHL